MSHQIDYELLSKTMVAVNGDDKNLLISYLLSKNREFTEVEKNYIRNRKSDFMTLKEGIENGVPILFCINSDIVYSSCNKETFDDKNITMLKGSSKVSRRTKKI